MFLVAHDLMNSDHDSVFGQLEKILHRPEPRALYHPRCANRPAVRAPAVAAHSPAKPVLAHRMQYNQGSARPKGLTKITSMGTSPRLSYQALKILRAMLDAGQKERTRAELVKATGLASGTVYQIILRLENSSCLESRWEQGDPSKLGRPRRRFYRLTRYGRAMAQQAIKEISPAPALEIARKAKA